MASLRFDERMMDECLRLAAKGAGFVSPNPIVGAVLVRNHQIIARGYHVAFGQPHAEVECLRMAAGKTRGTTLYVNLEPCCHHGKTPPCTDMILSSGIRRVVVGMIDPNPLVAGKGIATLRRKGINVTVGVRGRECESLNEIFATHIVKRRPYVHVKVAQTLDGKIAPDNRTRLAISSPSSQHLVHQWRATHDAVMIGATTLRTDDPRLTVRLCRGRDPVAVVIDGRLSVPLRANLWDQGGRRKVILYTMAKNMVNRKTKVEALRAKGVMVVPSPAVKEKIPISFILHHLYEMNIGSVLVEGGAFLQSQFLGAGYVDRISLFLAPVILGSGVSSFGTIVSTKPPINVKGSLTSVPVGGDILISATLTGRK